MPTGNYEQHDIRTQRAIHILVDFNIDLQSSKSKSTTFSKKVRHLGLKQLVTVPTRTEARYINGTFHITSTLIDHIYCSSERNVASIHIPPLSLSDHFPVFLVRRANAASRQMGNKPSIIQYRSLSNLNEVNFQNDLRSAPWSSIEAYDDPSDALAQWYHDDPHVLKNSGICKLSLQLQETSNANRIINYRYKMSSIQVQLLKRSVKPSK